MLSSYHPALSLSSLLDAFGPLIYPVYKAALLRKRILVLTEAPVELPCNFGDSGNYDLFDCSANDRRLVYDISILSSIPSSVADLLPLEPLPTRLQPLFAIGVHDIESLSRAKQQTLSSNAKSTGNEPNYGWIACSTDDVLGTKPTLFDILVTLPPSYTKHAKEKRWPHIKNASKAEIRASQRDLRRYRTLRQELQRTRSKASTSSPYASNNDAQPSTEAISTDDQAPLLSVPNTQETFDDASSTIDEKIIEPPSWSSLAYSSFMWWASAGEKRADLDEEAEHDAALFRDLIDYSASSDNQVRSRGRRASSSITALTTGGGGMTTTDHPPSTADVFFPEVSIIAYFHRLTALILSTLAEVVDTWDSSQGQRGEEEEGGGGRGETEYEECVLVKSDDMTRMGLDSWSEGDRQFVLELMELYWGRRARVQGTRIECCGVRIVG